jgi:hypothetical protein
VIGETMIKKLLLLTVALTFTLRPATALASPTTLVDNRVIIDNAPLNSVGAEDGLGAGNFGLNFPTFIDIQGLGAGPKRKIGTTVAAAFRTRSH